MLLTISADHLQLFVSAQHFALHLMRICVGGTAEVPEAENDSGVITSPFFTNIADVRVRTICSLCRCGILVLVLVWKKNKKSPAGPTLLLSRIPPSQISITITHRGRTRSHLMNLSRIMSNAILRASALPKSGPYPTLDPFLFCVYHKDAYPADITGKGEFVHRGNGDIQYC